MSFNSLVNSLLLELFDSPGASCWIELLPNEMYRSSFTSPSNVTYAINLLRTYIYDTFSTKEINKLTPNIRKALQDHPPYILSFNEEGYEDDEKDPHALTGAGSSPQVFGTVMTSVKDFASKKAILFKRLKKVLWPKQLTLNALKDLEKEGSVKRIPVPDINIVVLSASKSEPSRVRLYDRMSSYFSKQLSWDFATIDTKEDRYYIYSRK
jgi:hypothetical protein